MEFTLFFISLRHPVEYILDYLTEDAGAVHPSTLPLLLNTPMIYSKCYLYFVSLCVSHRRAKCIKSSKQSGR